MEADEAADPPRDFARDELALHRALVTHWRSGRAIRAPVQMTDKAAVAKIRTVAADHTNTHSGDAGAD